jgi:hypothetical protein
LPIGERNVSRRDAPSGDAAVEVSGAVGAAIVWRSGGLAWMRGNKKSLPLKLAGKSGDEFWRAARSGC